MNTPEQEAHAIAFGDDLFDEVSTPNDDGSFLSVNFERLEQRILAAIRAAVAAERERVIQAATKVMQEYSAKNAVDHETFDYLSGAESCARAIIDAIC